MIIETNVWIFLEYQKVLETQNDVKTIKLVLKSL